MKKTSQLVLQGIKLCIEKPGPLRNEIMTSPDFWVILQTLAKNSDSAPIVFEILESGVSGSPPAIMADNYQAAISLLNQFASAARVAVVSEPKPDRKQQPRKARPSKPEKPRLVSNKIACLPERIEANPASSDKPVVTRGVKAVEIIYSMTSRVPQLMKQSHLESSEGKHLTFALSCCKEDKANMSSLVCVLASHLPGSHESVY
jgi:brefeldin A-resistance guanine nucleotide exchange factor 1